MFSESVKGTSGDPWPSENRSGGVLPSHRGGPRWLGQPQREARQAPRALRRALGRPVVSRQRQGWLGRRHPHLRARDRHPGEGRASGRERRYALRAQDRRGVRRARCQLRAHFHGGILGGRPGGRRDGARASARWRASTRCESSGRTRTRTRSRSCRSPRGCEAGASGS